jgi:hypothetical protein
LIINGGGGGDGDDESVHNFVNILTTLFLFL